MLPPAVDGFVVLPVLGTPGELAALARGGMVPPLAGIATLPPAVEGFNVLPAPAEAILPLEVAILLPAVAMLPLVVAMLFPGEGTLGAMDAFSVLAGEPPCVVMNC
jgi:hypothetical protein